MEVLNLNTLTYNPEKIKNCFKIVKGATLTTKKIRIIFPARYIDIGLAKLGATVTTLCIFAVIDDKDNYAPVLATIIGKLSPSIPPTEIMVNDDKYIQITCDENSIVIPNNMMIVDDSYFYNLFKEFYLFGKIPWFISYEGLANLLLNTSKYNGSKIGNNPVTLEILTSIMARLEDKRVFYKSILNSRDDLKKKKPNFIGINDKYFSFDTTVSKIVGSYFKEGVLNAVVEPETETSVISDKLRE